MKKLKRNCSQILIMLLVFLMIINEITISAATKEKRVSTAKKLMKEMRVSKAETIVFSTNKEINLKIKAQKGSENKKLVIEAPNASITNAALFKSVTIKSAKSYTEKNSGNTITLKGDKIVFNVSSGKTVNKLNVESETADISIQKKARILELFCNKKKSSIKLRVFLGANVTIRQKKKCSLVIEGSKKANVEIASEVKGSKVLDSRDPSPTVTSIPTITPEPTKIPTATPTPSATPLVTFAPIPTETVSDNGSNDDFGVTGVPVVTSEPEDPLLTLEPISGIKHGDIITFGKYEQDNNLENGKEKIEWIVLSAYDGEALLMSRYILDNVKYDTSSANVKWEASGIRTWLNTNFYNDAFDTSEKKLICETNKYSNSDNVVLMNIGDMMNSYYGFSETTGSDLMRRGTPTRYAASKGVETYGSSITSDGMSPCIWWLYTNGTKEANIVDHYGNIWWGSESRGRAFDTYGVGVRPVIRVKCDYTINENPKNGISEGEKFNKTAQEFTIVNEDGSVTVREINRSGNAISEYTEMKDGSWTKKTYTYDDVDRVILMREESSAKEVTETQYEYKDSMESTLYCITPNLTIVRFYDSESRMLKETKKKDSGYSESTEYEYNTDGVLSRKIYSDSTGKGYEYNYLGDTVVKKKETDTYGNITEFELITDTGEEIEKKEYSNGYWEKHTRTYDEDRKVLSDYKQVSDGTWEKTKYGYDTAGNTTWYESENSSGTWQKEEYIYDEKGAILKKSSSDSSGIFVYEEYDDNGICLKRISKNETEGTEKTEVYDSKGLMLSLESFNSITKEKTELSYEYDETGRTKKTIEKNSNTDGTQVTTTKEYEFDENGYKSRDYTYREFSTGGWDKIEFTYNGQKTKSYYSENSEGIKNDMRYNQNGSIVYNKTVFRDGNTVYKLYLRRSDDSVIKQVVHNNPGNKREFYDYDENGTLLDSEDFLSSGLDKDRSYDIHYYRSEYFDGEGNFVQVKDELGCTAYKIVTESGTSNVRRIEYIYDGSRLLYEIGFDLLGNGYVDEYVYNEDNILMKTIHIDIDDSKNYVIEK